MQPTVVTCRRFPGHSFVTRATVVACLVISSVQIASAQTATRDSTTGSERVTVTAGAKYRAGWLHRAILGGDYRHLWTTPIEVELLDLRTEAGGLKPLKRGGSMQTNSLRFEAGNGREYVFRPLEKDFTKGLPEELRHTLVRDIAQDQVAGYHPAAALIVSRLLDATGIRHPRPRLFLMPDDSLLGEFRAEFKGILGALEERPDEDFDETPESPGATNVISSERLFERMRESHVNVPDRRKYLAARLFDILVGDRDRHRDQWRWGRFSTEKGALWEPIPRDRDMPFARFEGLGPWAIRGFVPQLVTFTSKYPDMVWLNWNGREIDRRLLVGLERAVWDSVVATLQRQMSDAVLDSAIAEMPPPWVERNRDELRSALVRRREQLPQAARDFYEILAREVDFSATDDHDLAEVTRLEGGAVHIALSATDSSDRSANARRETYLERRFEPGATREVRVFLHKGDDRVVVRGAKSGEILVRVIGGDGADVIADSIAGGDGALRFYDSAGNDRIESQGDASIDRRPYAAPTTARVEHAVRDWGTWSFMTRGASYAPAVGVLGSVSYTHFGYGFRQDPFGSRQSLRFDFSFGERRPRLVYEGTFRGINTQRRKELRVLASGIELIRFHGIGNDTPSDRGSEFYRVFQNLARVEPTLVVPIARGISASLGALAQYSSTRGASRTLVATAAPYGSGSFGEAGLRAGVSADRRDSPIAPTKGFRVAAGATFFPPIWDVARAFGEANIVASTYVSARGSLAPTLALRAGGQHVFGRFPFHEAAYLGGSGTLRGWHEQRFAGRSSLYGTGELRLRLGKISIIVPADAGVFGLADVGRVYADDEESNAWHSGVGGGVWLAPLLRSNTVSLSVVRSRERTGVYVRSGFAF